MMINTDSIVSITEADQNFSRVARMADEYGSAIILKNNAPRYILIDFNQAAQEQIAHDEYIMNISCRIIEKNREAYEILAL